LSWGRDRDLESTVNLVKVDLVRWDGWKAVGKAYLAEAPDEIPLKDVVHQYTEAVVQFYG
jgi:hypothetical protein